jgi:hypothetical protein
MDSAEEAKGPVIIYAMMLALLLQVSLPFDLPSGFNPEDYYLPVTTDLSSPEAPREAAALAEGLVAKGSPESIELAGRVLTAVLVAQETREGAAHRGNFKWRFSDKAIGDLNSVEFTLRHLIPMMIRHQARLPEPLRDRIRESIRLGLEEIARMNVKITYTNVATMDCMNSILGGELLDDASFAARGYKRLMELERVTTSNGTFYEYNTPTYTRVTHDALTRIARYTENKEAAIRARTLRARLALTAALHLHPATGVWAGPHGRGHNLSGDEAAPEQRSMLDQWIADGNAPACLTEMLDRPLPYSVWESVVPALGLGIMTYVDDAFAMGTATAEISRQSHVFLVHATGGSDGTVALVHSKYLIDDPDDVSEGTPGRRYVSEGGKFHGVQWGSRAIGLYQPRTLEHPGSLSPASQNRFRSAKAVVEFDNRAPDDRVWIAETPATKFPVDLDRGDVAVVECGDALVAVMPLSRDDLGYGAPLRIVRRGDRIILEMYNYLGPETVFWDMDRESRFFQGKPRCGFYAEVAPRDAYTDGAAFARKVASGMLRDEAAPPTTSYHDATERSWSVEYAREGQKLGIEVDLLSWRLKRRWTQDGELGWPLLESALARQTETGRVELGGAVVECGKAPAWLFALPERGVYVAGYHGPPAAFTLRTPEATIRHDAMGSGVVSWCNGKLDVDAIGEGEWHVLAAQAPDGQAPPDMPIPKVKPIFGDIPQKFETYAVVLQPDKNEPGWQAGAPSVVRDKNGIFWMAAHMRTAESPRGNRGFEIRILRSEDGIHFTRVHSIRWEHVPIGNFERPSLIIDPRTGRFKLYNFGSLNGSPSSIVKFDDVDDPTKFVPSTARAVITPTQQTDPLIRSVTGYKDQVIIYARGAFHCYVIGRLGGLERMFHFISDDGEKWESVGHPADPLMDFEGWHNFVIRPASVLPLGFGYLFVY